METLLVLVIGVLFACGTWLLQQKHLVRMACGLVLVSQGANLVIFTSAGLVRGRPAFIPESSQVVPEPYADPLAQALVLTAIVISFGVFAFFVFLIARIQKSRNECEVETETDTDTDTEIACLEGS